MAGFSASRKFRRRDGTGAMLRRLNEFPKPTVARVNGAAFAGGVGLISCCDIAIAAVGGDNSRSARCGYGLVPAPSAPICVAAIGPRAARRLFLDCRADFRRRSVPHRPGARGGAGDRTRQRRREGRRRCCSKAARERKPRAKRLIAGVSGRQVDEECMHVTAKGIADARASAEGREGVAVVLGEAQAAWRQ